MKSSLRKYVEFFALCSLAVALLWWFGRNLEWIAVRHAVGQSDKYLLGVAVLVICLAYLFRAYRWRALLAPLGPAGITHLFAATTIGFSAVFLIGRTGEVIRPVILPMRDARVRASASFVTIMVERIYDLMAVILLFALNLLWFKPTTNGAIEFSRVRMGGMILLMVAVTGIACLMWFKWNSVTVLGWLKQRLDQWSFVPRRLSHAVLSILEQLARALRVLVDARELAVTIAWTALVWAPIILANLLVVRAFGLPFGISETVFVLGFSLVGSLVPTPGGAAGAFHAATAAGLIFLGIARETAAAVSIVMHLVDFAPAIVFGFFYFVRGDINFSRLRSMTSPEAVEHAVEDEPIAPPGVFVPQPGETVEK